MITRLAEDETMGVQLDMTVELIRWFQTDLTIPMNDDEKERLAKESAAVAYGVVRDRVGAAWLKRLEGIRSAIHVREYGDFGVEIDRQREDLVEQFLRSIEVDPRPRA